MTSPPPDPGTTTPDRIIEVATLLFADHGFEKTTIRQISEAAGVNVAAINYHFSDKEALYFEVLARAHRCAQEQFPMVGAPEGMTAEQGLALFVEGFLRRVLTEDVNLVVGRLMAHEMLRPSRALDRLVEAEIRPKMKLLEGFVQALAGRSLPADVLRRLCFTVVGQVVFYKHAAPLIGRLEPSLVFDEKEIMALTRHITSVSIAAIRTTAGEGTSE